MNVGIPEGSLEGSPEGLLDREGVGDGSRVGPSVGCSEIVGKALGSLPHVEHASGQYTFAGYFLHLFNAFLLTHAQSLNFLLAMS
jgi:hypothetical protein